MAEKVEGELPGGEGAEDRRGYDREEVKSAKEIVQHLVKTCKTFKIYLPNNPIHQKFLAEFCEKVDRHLDAFGPLRLRVKQFQLLCSGQPVYEDPDRRESIAFKLSADGIGEVAFLPGVEREEMIGFLEVLGKAGDDQADDDTVTLLWEKNLTHIQYSVVEDFLVDMKPEECKEMQVRPVAPEQLQEALGRELPPDHSLAVKSVEVASLHAFKLTEEEIGQLEEEVRLEEQLDMVGELEGILFDILRIERDPALFSEILAMLNNILESLMLRGDFRHARKVIEFYREMLDPAKNLSEPLQAQFHDALRQAGSPERIVQLQSILDNAEDEALEDFFSLIALLDTAVIPPLVDLLGNLEKMKPRRLLCDVLVRIGKGNVDYFTSRLDDHRWYLVRNLVYILGNIGAVAAIKDIARLIRHDYYQVRRAVFRALSGMDDPDADRLLVEFISDTDTPNRLSAVKTVGRKRIKEALDPLLKVLAAKDFHAKEFHEKKEIIEAIGNIGGESVVPKLQEFLPMGWSLFKNAKAEETACLIVEALRKIGTLSARKVIREGSQSRNKTIREACHKALETVDAARA